MPTEADGRAPPDTRHAYQANRYALRKKLGQGLPLERAWQELQFEVFDDIYQMSLLPGGRLRMSWHPEMDPKDWLPLDPWEGDY